MSAARGWHPCLGIGAALAVAAALVGMGCGRSGKDASMDSSRFYDADGKFNERAAKEAYLAFLEEQGYPVGDNLRKNLWVSDFGLGRFTEAGLGVLFWIDDKEFDFGGLDAFLLPGQMIPEHWHVAVPGVRPKMEAWHVRWGAIYTYGEGEPTPTIRAKVPPEERPHLTARKETVLKVGDVRRLGRPLEKHWMQAGPKGAVFTEYSTYHAGDAVKFTNPKVKF